MGKIHMNEIAGEKKPRRGAFEKAIDSIARRMRTERQIRDLLEGRGRGRAASAYSQEEIDEVIERLKDLGYIDDRAYAERFLEVAASKKRGRRRIADEMRRAGIGAALAESVISEGYPHEAERENAMSLARAALATFPADMDKRKKTQKLSARLMTQGYDYSQINSVITSLRMDDET
jgi:regulatory protein